MSKLQDIRSFFTVVSSKKGDTTASKVPPASSRSKKKPRIVDSDDDDVIAGTPEQLRKPPTQKKKLKLLVLSSDSEDESKAVRKRIPSKPASTSKNPVRISSSEDEEDVKKTLSSKSTKTKEFPKLKPINVDDVFKKTPIKQSKVEVVIPKPSVSNAESTPNKTKNKNKKLEKKKNEITTHSDSAFRKTLQELDDDDDFFMDNEDLLDKTIEEALLKAGEKTEKFSSRSEVENIVPKTNEISGSNKNKVDEETPNTTSVRKRSRNDSSHEESTPKKSKFDHTDSGIDPGQEAYEKKKYSAMLYQKYLNRSGPKHLGMREYPEGKPTCLQNLCFLRTGVLDSLDSEAFSDLIKKHGGRVVHSVSKKVNYLVVGDEPGPSKLDKAKGLRIPFLSEDELLDLILTKSGKEPKYCKKSDKVVSEDLGIETGSHNNSFEEDNVNDKTSKTEPAKTKKSPEKDEPKLVLENKIEPKAGSSKKLETKPEPKRIERQTIEVSPEYLTLSEKYKPKDLSGIIGQQTDTSNMNKLKKWLQNWHRNQRPEVKKHIVKPSPWAKNDDGAAFKCALLSGPPGIGKTTTATLVAKALGLDVVEFNASDTRSKRLLHEEVSQLLSTKTIAGFATGKGGLSKNRVLLMDEVDGMAGNQDRGGMQELIQLIKNSSIPIICMCNDRNHQKMRSLGGYCFDLKFSKPRLEQIRGALMTVCFRENYKISPNVLTEIIAGTGCDIRQSLNHLSMWAASPRDISVEDAHKRAQVARKDTVMGPWEVCRTVFTKSEHKDMSLFEKSKLFFYDYSMGPLFVQENYLRVQPVGDKKEALRRAAAAAESISLGDTIDAKIRRTNNWSLLETEAMFASVIPGYVMSGHFVGPINFPAWLGKNSKRNKFQRLCGEIQSHTRTSTCANKMAIKLDYLLPLRDSILNPLKKRGLDGVQEAVDVMKTYKLLREDLDGLVELSQWSSRSKNPMTSIDSKVKSAFTRAYNKQIPLLPFAAISATAKKKSDVNLESELPEIGDEGDEVESDKEEDDDLANNPTIKVKKKTAAAKTKTSEAGPSKKGASKGGKGKKK